MEDSPAGSASEQDEPKDADLAVPDEELEQDGETREPSLLPVNRQKPTTGEKIPLNKGVMKRPQRAQCRILHSRGGFTISALALKYNRTQEYVQRVILNDNKKFAADVIEEDYDYVDHDTKVRYPPTASLIPSIKGNVLNLMFQLTSRAHQT